VSISLPCRRPAQKKPRRSGARSYTCLRGVGAHVCLRGVGALSLPRRRGRAPGLTAPPPATSLRSLRPCAVSATDSVRAPPPHPAAVAGPCHRHVQARIRFISSHHSCSLPHRGGPPASLARPSTTSSGIGAAIAGRPKASRSNRSGSGRAVTSRGRKGDCTQRRSARLRSQSVRYAALRHSIRANAGRFAAYAMRQAVRGRAHADRERAGKVVTVPEVGPRAEAIRRLVELGLQAKRKR
jgi:hypothetical protein